MNPFSSLLSYSVFYDLSQRLMGASRNRSRIVEKYIRPFDGCSVLDIGSGTSGIFPLLGNLSSYVAVEPNIAYVKSVHRQFGGLENFAVHHGYFDDELARRIGEFDIVLLLGVVHHLDDNAAISLFNRVKALLRAGGRLVTVDGCFREGQNILKRKLLELDRGEYVRPEADYRLLAEETFPHVKVNIEEVVWPPYTHCIMECSNDSRSV